MRLNFVTVATDSHRTCERDIRTVTENGRSSRVIVLKNVQGKPYGGWMPPFPVRSRVMQKIYYF